MRMLYPQIFLQVPKFTEVPFGSENKCSYLAFRIKSVKRKLRFTFFRCFAVMMQQLHVTIVTEIFLIF